MNARLAKLIPQYLVYSPALVPNAPCMSLPRKENSVSLEARRVCWRDNWPRSLRPALIAAHNRSCSA